MAAPRSGAQPEAAEQPAGGDNPGLAPGTEGPRPTPEPTADPEKIAEECKQAISAIRSGDLDALNDFSPLVQSRIGDSPTTEKLYSCLAIATGKPAYCDHLAGRYGEDCKNNLRISKALRSMPAGQIKPYIMYESCLVGGTAEAQCEIARDALTEKDAEKCNELESATSRLFCLAVVEEDASKCAEIEDATLKGTCEAYATNDPDLCPSDSADCQNWTRAFSAIAQGGLGAVENPALAAIQQGIEACDPLLDEVAALCLESRTKN